MQLWHVSKGLSSDQDAGDIPVILQRSKLWSYNLDWTVALSGEFRDRGNTSVEGGLE